jgi:hypothetical protein
MNISQTRCFNHASREAVARCPECGRYFCRECVSEHEDRIICAFCLKRLTKGTAGKRRRGGLFAAMAIAAGVLLLWTSFYLLGKALLAVPSSFQQMGSAEGQRQER